MTQFKAGILLTPRDSSLPSNHW